LIHTQPKAAGARVAIKIKKEGIPSIPNPGKPELKIED